MSVHELTIANIVSSSLPVLAAG